MTIAFVLLGRAMPQEPAAHQTVVPLHQFQQGQWVEKVWGDFSKPGEPFVLRIHQDAGYIVFPHTHPIDENLTIVKGTWALGMGRHFDPVYELAPQGVTLLTSLLLPGTPATSYPPNCFPLKIGAGARSDRGEGVVIGARCSPVNQHTQYWIKEANGERFWATLQELKPRS